MTLLQKQIFDRNVFQKIQNDSQFGLEYLNNAIETP